MGLLNGCHTVDPTPHTNPTLHKGSKSYVLVFQESKMTTVELSDVEPYSPFLRPINPHCPHISQNQKPGLILRFGKLWSKGLFITSKFVDPTKVDHQGAFRVLLHFNPLRKTF